MYAVCVCDVGSCCGSSCCVICVMCVVCVVLVFAVLSCIVQCFSVLGGSMSVVRWYCILVVLCVAVLYCIVELWCCGVLGNLVLLGLWDPWVFGVLGS